MRRDLVTPDDSRDLFRALGALLLGVGVLVLSVRKDNPSGFVENDGWGAWALFAVYLAAATVLYGGAVASIRETGGLRKWQAIASVFGLLFVPFALGNFVDAVGGSPDAPMNVAWIAAVTAALGFYAGVVAGVRFQVLVGALALLVAYLAFFDEVLTDGVFSDNDLLRGLLLAYAVSMIAVGIVLWRRDREGLWQASELLTAAGIAAVVATLVLSLTGAFGNTIQDALTFGGGEGKGESPSGLWDVAGLLVCLFLICAGALIGTRGPVYVGGIGLVLFAFVAGQNLDADRDDRENGFFWWPFILLILGAGAVAASLLPEASLGRRPRRWVRKVSGR
jgi:hypothetical protein